MGFGEINENIVHKEEKEKINKIDSDEAIRKGKENADKIKGLQVKAAKSEFIEKYGDRLNKDAINNMKITNGSKNSEFVVNINPEKSNWPEYIISNNGEILLDFNKVLKNKNFKDAASKIGYIEKKEGKTWHTYINGDEVAIDVAFKQIKQELDKMSDNDIPFLSEYRENCGKNENGDLKFMLGIPLMHDSSKDFLEEGELKKFQKISEYMNKNNIQIINIKEQGLNGRNASIVTYNLTGGRKVDILVKDNMTNEKEILDKLIKSFNLDK